ncbi:nuclear pore component [Nitzschia inconspicua]|uniref:Nuclear pore component n=1 Tax=Nitzschia inconspicua TaxID=303405 RepID=A0A9K3PUB5_9STRA|nr:nuclear pore component [Nitzschia inconspicua]
MYRSFRSPMEGFGSPPGGREGVASFTSPSFMTPSPAGLSQQRDPSYSGNTAPSPSSSVRLSCSSPDGKAVYSLMTTSSGDCFIETHTLPLAGTVEATNVDAYDSKAAIIRTHLPHNVTSALSRYPAMELLCLGGAAPSSTTTHKPQQRGPTSANLMPFLCLYTKKDVFLLKLCYEPNGSPEAEGTVISVDEPYDDFLMSNSNANIIRIQPAPQQAKGYATICPPMAMAMLTQDQSTKMYSLTLYHGPPPPNKFTMESLTDSHEFGTEELDDPTERIVDFCFCKSPKLSLLSSLTVAFLKGNGKILFATPIVFKGTVVASAAVTESLDFLAASVQEEQTFSPFFNQYAAAKKFITDAFPNLGRSSFVTTAFGSSEESMIFEWGVQIQGPLISLPPAAECHEVTEFFAKSIVPFGGAGDLVGFAVGYSNETVDIAVASPTALIPRFMFEKPDDAAVLDANLPNGVCVDRVEFSSDNKPLKDIFLVPDPIMEFVVHLVTPSHIVSVSSNAAQIASNKAWEDAMKETDPNALLFFSPPSKRGDLKPKTTAWSCLDVAFFQGNQNPIVGAIVSSNVEFGHIFVVRLGNGKMTAINLTEKRHLNEMDDLPGKRSVPALQLMGGYAETESLADLIQPLIQKVYDGISNMAQIGGSSTMPEDMTVDVLAGAMSIYERVKKEVYLPLTEMNEHVNVRRAELKHVVQKQLEALEALKEVIGKLREKQYAIQEQMDILYSNSRCLEERSSSALQSCNDLQPTITQAEYDHFQEIKRLDDKTKAWKSQAEILKVKVASITDLIESDNTKEEFDLPVEQLKQAKEMLGGSEKYIYEGKSKLDSLSRNVDQLAAFTGYISQRNRPLPLKE